jgi:hypothetical protein
MSVIHFPKSPCRAIRVRCVAKGKWVGHFGGDPWQKPFRTNPGEFRPVFSMMRRARARCGLPVIVVPQGMGGAA